MEGDYNTDVDEAKKHDGSRPELPARSVLCKECKLVSLALCGTLLRRKSAAFVGRLGPSKGTLASSLLL